MWLEINIFHFISFQQLNMDWQKNSEIKLVNPCFSLFSFLPIRKCAVLPRKKEKKSLNRAQNFFSLKWVDKDMEFDAESKNANLPYSDKMHQKSYKSLKFLVLHFNHNFFWGIIILIFQALLHTKINLNCDSFLI
jgi:hypothetical protein